MPMPAELPRRLADLGDRVRARLRLPEHPLPVRDPAGGAGPARPRRRLAARRALGERGAAARPGSAREPSDPRASLPGMRTWSAFARSVLGLAAVVLLGLPLGGRAEAERRRRRAHRVLRRDPRRAAGRLAAGRRRRSRTTSAATAGTGSSGTSTPSSATTAPTTAASRSPRSRSTRRPRRTRCRSPSPAGRPALRIGDPARTITGRHTYRISYLVEPRPRPATRTATSSTGTRWAPAGRCRWSGSRCRSRRAEVTRAACYTGAPAHDDAVRVGRRVRSERDLHAAVRWPPATRSPCVAAFPAGSVAAAAPVLTDRLTPGPVPGRHAGRRAAGRRGGGRPAAVVGWSRCSGGAGRGAAATPPVPSAPQTSPAAAGHPAGAGEHGAARVVQVGRPDRGAAGPGRPRLPVDQPGQEPGAGGWPPPGRRTRACGRRSSRCCGRRSARSRSPCCPRPAAGSPPPAARSATRSTRTWSSSAGSPPARQRQGAAGRARRDRAGARHPGGRDRRLPAARRPGRARARGGRHPAGRRRPAGARRRGRRPARRSGPSSSPSADTWPTLDPGRLPPEQRQAAFAGLLPYAVVLALAPQLAQTLQAAGVGFGYDGPDVVQHVLRRRDPRLLPGVVRRRGGELLRRVVRRRGRRRGRRQLVSGMSAAAAGSSPR